MNNFEIINNTSTNISEINELNELNEFVNYAIKFMNLENVMFNIVVVNDDEMHKINKEYRGIDRTTDVISFALEDDKTFIKTEIRILGDIYISLDKAKEQAMSYGHSLKREISFLTIHGILHLLGYDHMNEKEEKEMFRLQELILDEFGIQREKNS